MCKNDPVQKQAPQSSQKYAHGENREDLSDPVSINEGYLLSFTEAAQETLTDSRAKNICPLQMNLANVPDII